MCAKGTMKRLSLVSLAAFVLVASAGCKPTDALRYLANVSDGGRSEAVEAAETLESLERWSSRHEPYYWLVDTW